MKRLLLFCMIVAVVSLGVFSETPSGIGAASFARLGIDARPLAMGGAFVAIAEGGAAAYYNPAGLATVKTLTVGGMYSRPYGEDFGITFQYLSILGYLGTQTPSFSGVGVAGTWLRMEIADIPIWEEEGPSSTFTATSSVYLASVGVSVSETGNWAVGGSAKIYRDRILEGRGDGLGFDLGVLGSFQIADVPLAIGINSMDIGRTKIHWRETTGEPVNYVPWVNKVGLSTYLLDRLILLACDFDWAVGRPAREQTIHFGTEVRPLEALSLRVGWSGDLEGTGAFAGGIGVYLFGMVSVDYAYVPGKAFGATHFVSAQFSF